MKDKVFIDTNILIYLFSNDIYKKDMAKELLINNPTISIQVCNEISNILLKKYNFNEIEVKEILQQILKNVNLYKIEQKTIFKALDIKNRYHFSYYDSLIISSAVKSNCNILYSEDMQHNQQIYNLKIINPFKEK